MIDVLLGVSTGCRGVDSGRIIREAINNLEADRCWTIIVYSVFKFVFIIGGNVDCASKNIDLIIRCLHSAVAIFCVVWVALFTSEATIVHDVLEGL